MPSPRRLATAALLSLVGIASAGATVAPAASLRSAWPSARDGTTKNDTLRGSSRADYIRGHEGPDRLFGKGGADLLTGDTGADIVNGGAGDDTITGAAGGDHLNGADGADVILGGFGSDHIDGGTGDDTIDGANDSDFIKGGAGNDLIHGGSGPDLIDGGAGDDTLYADSGGDVLAGGEGDDVIFVDSTSASKISCGAGNDVLYFVQPADLPEDFSPRATKRVPDCERTVLTDAVVDPNQGAKYLAPDSGGTRTGTARDDLLLGGPGADVLNGGAGNDVLWGLRQAGLTSSLPDVLDAGPGDDTIYGGPGPQTIDGGAGDDFINGGLGTNAIRGGAGKDTIRLRGSGTATVDGGAGNDTIYVNGPAAGRVRCGAGTDTVYANRNDRIARDCERLRANPGSSPSRLRAAARQAATPAPGAADAPAPGSATYADLVRATPGLAHWWRLSSWGPTYSAGTVAALSVTPDAVGGRGAFATGTVTEPGATDDGDGSWVPQGSTLSVYLADSVLGGAGSTIELWARSADPAARAGTDNLVTYSGYDQSQGQAVRLTFNRSGGVEAAVTPYGGTATVARSAAQIVSAGAWHHVALTRDGTSIRVYLDGVEVATAADIASTGPVLNEDWKIGTASSASLAGLDELALYSRALDAETVRAHAKVGDDGRPPVTKLDRPIPALIGSPYRTTLSTARAGSRFRCLIDGTTDISCPSALVARLPVGEHTLQLRATDRFGRKEVSPATYSFTVDGTDPETLAAAVLGLTGNVPSALTFGSDDFAATFQCATAPAGTVPIGDVDALRWAPCVSGTRIPDATAARVFVRAVDVAGNVDATPSRIDVAARESAAQGVVPALGAARADVVIGEVEQRDPTTVFACQVDALAGAACAGRFRLPLLRHGGHTLRITQAGYGLAGARIVAAPLAIRVGPPPNVTLTAVQFPAVVESSSALSVRVPRVRLVLDGPAELALAVTGADGKQIAAFRAAGVTGPNAPKIPASALRRLGLGRYTLVVAARGPSGSLSVERLPFAVIPRNR
ncbi:hypothetical protein DSM112329_05017 [Paraconexibacter sp. AEG42_29]|uniref:LamG-like jellyroll fold domain-containing protein n=1 Tax=Paraconexibacter sp. AEG42_29 TaxID=2997339 RepID=A0AAU7B2M1_9ACTN